MPRLSDFAKIKAALDAEDIEGLLTLGAPGDEYQSEASLIESGLTRGSDFGKKSIGVEAMADVIASVWDKQFGPFSREQLEQRRSAFLAVARRIVE